ncbi:MAG: single-stranded DNA-binding protein [Selenomonadaceae bacterium]|nr:single-stranded DNA-binding protein [Selenomonadaceae bacterium]
MNKVVLIGRLTRDPELRTTQAGTPVCTFSLAVDRRVKRDENSNQPTADFIPIVTWGKTAEFCNQYFSKGNRMAVEGRIQTRNYEAQDGTKRYVTEVIAENVEFCESKRSADSYGSGYNSNYGGNYGNQTENGLESRADALGPNVSNEEIPF